METNTTTSGLDPLLSIEDLSDYLHVPPDALRLAPGRQGACAVHVGRQLRYFTSDVVAWLARHKEAEPGQAPGE